MKSSIFVFGISGLLLFVASGLFNILSVGAITLKVDELLLNLAATMLSICALTIIYQFIGEEPTIKLLNDLVSMLQTSKKMNQLGIEGVAGKRSEFDIPEMHLNFAKGNNAFVASRDFSAIKHNRVKELILEMIKSNKQIRVLISSDATTKKDIKTFRDNLSVEERKHFEVKVGKSILCGMYGNEKIVYATLPFHKYSGDESPSLFCVSNDNKDTIHSIFLKEFDYVWENKSQPI